MAKIHHSKRSNKKITKDTHRFPKNICLTVGEWADHITVRPAVIRRWIKSGELKPIDNHRPMLIHALDVVECLEHKNQARKKRIASNEIYCCTCKEGRKPIPETIQLDYVIHNQPIIRGVCSVCDGQLSCITTKGKAQQKIAQLKMLQCSVQQLSHSRIQHGVSLLDERHLFARYNPANERLKYQYREYLREVGGFPEKSLKVMFQNILRCERILDYANITDFDKNVAMTLKQAVRALPLAQSTIIATLGQYQKLLCWVRELPRHRHQFTHHDIHYLNINRNEKKSLRAKRMQQFPKPKELVDTIVSMPSDSVKDKRNRAMIVVLALTGLRDGTLIHLRLKHLNIEARYLVIDPQEVPVKCGSYHVIALIILDERLLDILQDYVIMLKKEYHFRDDDPLFPKLMTEHCNHHFTHGDFSNQFLADAQIVQRLCKQVFLKHLGKAYTPHSIRHSLAYLSKKLATNPQELKALSQNLGHKTTMHMMETYGQIDHHRQLEIIQTEMMPRLKSIL